MEVLVLSRCYEGIEAIIFLVVCMYKTEAPLSKKSIYKRGDENHCRVERRIVALYYHKCPDCGKRMRQAD